MMHRLVGYFPEDVVATSAQAASWTPFKVFCVIVRMTPPTIAANMARLVDRYMMRQVTVTEFYHQAANLLRDHSELWSLLKRSWHLEAIGDERREEEVVSPAEAEGDDEAQVAQVEQRANVTPKWTWTALEALGIINMLAPTDISLTFFQWINQYLKRQVSPVTFCTRVVALVKDNPLLLLPLKQGFRLAVISPDETMITDNETKILLLSDIVKTLKAKLPANMFNQLEQLIVFLLAELVDFTTFWSQVKVHLRGRPPLLVLMKYFGQYNTSSDEHRIIWQPHYHVINLIEFDAPLVADEFLNLLVTHLRTDTMTWSELEVQLMQLFHKQTYLLPLIKAAFYDADASPHQPRWDSFIVNHLIKAVVPPNVFTLFCEMKLLYWREEFSAAVLQSSAILVLDDYPTLLAPVKLYMHCIKMQHLHKAAWSGWPFIRNIGYSLPRLIVDQFGALINLYAMKRIDSLVFWAETLMLFIEHPKFLFPIKMAFRINEILNSGGRSEANTLMPPSIDVASMMNELTYLASDAVAEVDRCMPFAIRKQFYRVLVPYLRREIDELTFWTEVSTILAGNTQLLNFIRAAFQLDVADVEIEIDHSPPPPLPTGQGHSSIELQPSTWTLLKTIHLIVELSSIPYEAFYGALVPFLQEKVTAKVFLKEMAKVLKWQPHLMAPLKQCIAKFWPNAEVDEDDDDEDEVDDDIGH